MKYIDAEKLIAEIDDILSACTKQTHTGVYNTCHRIKGIITSLQQELPEVDLEKELDKFYGMYRKDGKTYDIKDGEECVDWKEMFNPYAEIEFARHFFKLGLNARKK